jgi:hypothetical protein
MVLFPLPFKKMGGKFSLAAALSLGFLEGASVLLVCQTHALRIRPSISVHRSPIADH